jgi:hypothetical protein
MNRRTWRQVRAVVIWAAIPILIWIWIQPTDPTVRAALSATYIVFFLLAARIRRGRPRRRRRCTGCRRRTSASLNGLAAGFTRAIDSRPGDRHPDVDQFRRVGRVRSQPNGGRRIGGASAGRSEPVLALGATAS